MNLQLIKLIWYNSFIKINNKYVYYKTWANKGILFLKDLFNDTTWLTYDEFCMKYYFRPPFTVYNGLILAIKTYYKMDKYRELGTVQMQIIPNCLKELLKTNVCKKFYKECVNGYTSKHKINPQIKWHHILGTELCDKWWENVYLIPFKLTTDTGLRYFQYKIFNFILTTNRQLVIYGIKNSDKCEFCHMFSEDLMHIFWLCKHVQTFWNTVINWIFFKTKIRLQVNAQTIILGNPNYSKKDSVCSNFDDKKWNSYSDSLAYVEKDIDKIYFFPELEHLMKISDELNETENIKRIIDTYSTYFSDTTGLFKKNFSFVKENLDIINFLPLSLDEKYRLLFAPISRSNKVLFSEMLDVLCDNEFVSFDDLDVSLKRDISYIEEMIQDINIFRWMHFVYPKNFHLGSLNERYVELLTILDKEMISISS